jgi:hypothetical protein
MKRNAFLIAFITIILALAIMVVVISRNQSDRFLESDIVRNGQQLQILLERFHETLGKGTYPDSIYELFHSGAVWYRDRMRNPYTRDSIRISDDMETSFEPGNLLYVGIKKDTRGRPTGYKIYMLGRKTDPFYNSQNALIWQEEYKKYTLSEKAPDNIVMVFESPGSEPNDV